MKHFFGGETEKEIEQGPSQVFASSSQAELPKCESSWAEFTSTVSSRVESSQAESNRTSKSCKNNEKQKKEKSFFVDIF